MESEVGFCSQALYIPPAARETQAFSYTSASWTSCELRTNDLPMVWWDKGQAEKQDHYKLEPRMENNLALLSICRVWQLPQWKVPSVLISPTFTFFCCRNSLPSYWI